MFETVRHVIHASLIPPFFFPFVGFFFSALLLKKVLTNCISPSIPRGLLGFSISIAPLRSFQYLTLNPGQEATEPMLSPRDPVRAIIRADERAAAAANSSVV